MRISAIAILVLVLAELSAAWAQQRTCYTTRLQNGQSVTRCY